MLKITKGLKPPIINDNSNGIHTYTDEEGNEYVRVKNDNEDFCIASSDYVKGSKDKFEWDEAMEALEALENDGWVTLTLSQAQLCKNNQLEINNRLKEIGGKAFEYDGYWTSAECVDDAACAWVYVVNQSLILDASKLSVYRMRLILNL